MLEYDKYSSYIHIVAYLIRICNPQPGRDTEMYAMPRNRVALSGKA